MRLGRCEATPRDASPDAHDFSALATLAGAEGFRFIRRLCDEWTDGEDRFDGPGERLVGCLDDSVVIAVGGLNRDPYADDPSLGRLRHHYVHPDYRRNGTGHLIVAVC